MRAPDADFDPAARLFNRQEYDRSATLARQSLERYPDDGRLWQLYGTSLWALGAHGAALAALETATSLAPLYPLPQRALADCYARAGKKELALTVYQHLVASQRCPSSLLPSVAAALNCLDAYELALQACRTLTDRDPTHHQGFFGTAYYLSQLGAPPEELLTPLAMAMDLAPDMLHYRINLAFVWAELGDLSLAHELLGPIAIEQVASPCWLIRMHTIFERVGDHLRSLQCLDRLEKLQQCGRKRTR